MAFFDELSKKISGTAKNMQEKTRDSIEMGKLNQEEKQLTAALAAKYTELGKLAEGILRQSGDAAVCGVIAQIDDICARIKAVNARKDYLRQMLRCPSCGTAIPAGSKFCPSCGARLPEAEASAPEAQKEEYCANCGAVKRPGMKFCAICGKPYEKSEDESILIRDFKAQDDLSSQGGTEEPFEAETAEESAPVAEEGAEAENTTQQGE